MEFSKPVIAAVSGWAVAGGLELALMCDIRVVDENARLGVLCRRFGVPLIDGGTVRLPELIGLSRALDLILTGRIVEAKEAHQMGLANRLVPAGTAYGHAVNLARELARFPQECLRADRRSAYHATFASRSLEESLQFEIENGLNVISKVGWLRLLFEYPMASFPVIPYKQTSRRLPSNLTVAWIGELR